MNETHSSTPLRRAVVEYPTEQTSNCAVNSVIIGPSYRVFEVVAVPWAWVITAVVWINYDYYDARIYRGNNWNVLKKLTKNFQSIFNQEKFKTLSYK